MNAIAVFLCDLTGRMAEPWAEAGYDCYCVDIQHSIRRERIEGRIHFVWGDARSWRPPEGRKIVFGGAFSPCTHVSGSGARDWKIKGGFMLRDALEIFEFLPPGARMVRCALHAGEPGRLFFVDQAYRPAEPLTFTPGNMRVSAPTTTTRRTPVSGPGTASSCRSRDPRRSLARQTIVFTRPRRPTTALTSGAQRHEALRGRCSSPMHRNPDGLPLPREPHDPRAPIPHRIRIPHGGERSATEQGETDMSETKVERTPGPWRIWDSFSEQETDEYPPAHKGDLRIVGSDNICLGIIFGGWPTIDGLDANAAFIVEAVNSHDALVAQQAELAKALWELIGATQRWDCSSSVRQVARTSRALLSRIKAAQP